MSVRLLGNVSLDQIRQAEASASDRKAFVDEMLTRLRNAVDPATAKVKVTTKQDRVDSEHTRLTRGQASDLMNAPKRRDDNTPLQALRDTAMIALMLCTGAREMELCGLDVKDLRQRVNDELVLHIREGKGAKERVVPYGNLEWCLSIVYNWRLVSKTGYVLVLCQCRCSGASTGAASQYALPA